MTSNTFADLAFKPHWNWDGVQATVSYPNGYGASVIKADGSYGYEDDLYELAVLKDGKLCYTTPLTDDVIGRLSEQAVTDLLQQIAALPQVEEVG